MQASTAQAQTQPGTIHLTEAERAVHDRLLKLAPEIDRFEGYTVPHATEVARLAERLGAAAGLHGADLVALRFAALAHDLGERTMKRNYLLRPDALTWEETLDLWRHPIIGEQQAAELKLPRQAQLLIRWHHEWWNGRGYPDGLTGVAIPLGARILRAADTYCALIADRPWRAAFNPLAAEQLIADGAGIEFEPSIAKLLLLLLADDRREFEAQYSDATALAPIPADVPPNEPELNEPELREAQALADAQTMLATPEAPETMEAVAPLPPALLDDEEVMTDERPAEPVPLAEHALSEPLPVLEAGPAPESAAPLAHKSEAPDALLGETSQNDESRPPSPHEVDTEEFERVPPAAPPREIAADAKLDETPEPEARQDAAQFHP